MAATNGDTDVDPCTRTQPCPHRESGVQDGMEYGESCGRYNAEQKALGAQEEHKFVHAVADLMPLAMRTSGKFISVPTQGEASLRELSRRHAAGDVAGDIDVLSWAGAPF